jgi:ABC-type spermidine/putrescine transport system permease subunit I
MRPGVRPRATGRVLEHALAGLPALWRCGVFLVPLGFTVVFSFGHSSFGGIALGFTLDNYKQALSGFYLDSFVRTIRFALSGCALCLLVAYPAALYISRQTGTRRTVLLLIVLVPYFTSFLIRVMSWQILLARGGPIEWVLNVTHLSAGPLDVIDTQTAVFIGLVYAYLPITIVPIYLVLIRIPPVLLEASQDLGASGWQTFRHVVLPLSRPGLATAALLTGVPMLGELVIPALLGGDKGVLMGMAIAQQYLATQDYALGSAMAVLVLIAVAMMVLLLVRLTRGFEEIPA